MVLHFWHKFNHSVTGSLQPLSFLFSFFLIVFLEVTVGVAPSYAIIHNNTWLFNSIKILYIRNKHVRLHAPILRIYLKLTNIYELILFRVNVTTTIMSLPIQGKRVSDFFSFTLLFFIQASSYWKVAKFDDIFPRNFSLSFSLLYHYLISIYDFENSNNST